MSTPRRRSKRLASATKPQLQPQLDSVSEQDESSVGRFATDIKQLLDAASMPPPATPMKMSPVKLPMAERHPSKVHPTTTAAPSPGLQLGFADINRGQDARNSREQPSGIMQSTPSKAPVPVSAFTFRLGQANDSETELGPAAQRMMEELRDEAARIKAELASKREQERADVVAQGRTIAKPKGKAGRYSDIHMAEFKKMDSIAKHPSALRTLDNRAPMLAPSMKRSQSKSSLDDGDVTRKTGPSQPVAAQQTDKKGEQQLQESEGASKRPRQRIEDDASTSRPLSREGTSLPRPKSSGKATGRSGIPRSQTLGHIGTPTQSSIARASTTPTPTPIKGLVRSASKPDLGRLKGSPSRPDMASLLKPPRKVDFASMLSNKKAALPGKKVGLTKSATMGSLDTAKSVPTHVQTPGRFARVKSILKRQFSSSKAKSNIPKWGSPSRGLATTPGGAEEEEAGQALTTPGRRFSRHVDFTPDTKLAALTQNTPSPIKSAIPLSKSMSKLPALASSSVKGGRLGGKEAQVDVVSYPDLSAHSPSAKKQRPVTEAHTLPKAVPGTFSFRSDHTIRFGSSSPTGFGSSAGQASLRQVRQSTGPLHVPGSFPKGPTGSEMSPNKENTPPGIQFGIAHGMSNKKRHVALWEDDELKTGIPHGIANKKRHRASDDEAEDGEQGAKRGAKKARKTHDSPHGSLSVARRLGASPLKRPSLFGTPGSQKKSGLTMSRLNMLAQPKRR